MVPLRVTCTHAGGCRGTLTVRSRSGKKPVVARGAYRVARGATRTVKLRTTARGRTLLRDQRTLKAKVTARSTRPKGLSAQASVQLRRAR